MAIYYNNPKKTNLIRSQFSVYDVKVTLNEVHKNL